MKYTVAAMVESKEKDWTREKQVPSFVVNASSEEEAEKIAKEIINPLGNPNIQIYLGIAENITT